MKKVNNNVPIRKKRIRRNQAKKYKRRRRIVLVIFLLFIVGIINITLKTFKKSNSPNINKKKVSTEKVQKKPIKITKKENKTEVLLSFAGDCTIGTDPRFSKKQSLTTVVMNNNNDYSYLFKNVHSIFDKDDLTIVNLETTFTESKVRANKKFTFKAPPEFAKSLNSGSIEGVNISNNHIYDFLQKGFDDTLNTLKNHNINFFGEGHKWIKEVKGVKFGFLGYTGWDFNDNIKSKLQNDIQELKKQGCIVIINFHWGIEGTYYPCKTQKDIAHYAIDNGADLIVGHHPHVIQGIEKYKDKIICYSMGNFCFGGNFNPSDKDTFILQSKFYFTDSNLDKYTINIIPCKISSVNYVNDYCPTPLKGEDKEQILNKLKKISSPFGSINFE